jgi:hypothetical protein
MLRITTLALLGAVAIFSAAWPNHALASGACLMSTLPDGPDYACSGIVTANLYALGCRHKETRNFIDRTLLPSNLQWGRKGQIMAAMDRYIDAQIAKGECKEIPSQTVVRILEVDPLGTGTVCVAEMAKDTDHNWPSEEELITRRYWIQPRAMSLVSFSNAHPFNEREYWNLQICPR